jgi:hypothetical protein
MSFRRGCVDTLAQHNADRIWHTLGLMMYALGYPSRYGKAYAARWFTIAQGLT